MKTDRLHNIQSIMLVLMFAMLAAITSSCADEDLAEAAGQGKEVRFAVSVDGRWHSAAVSRGEDRKVANLDVRTLYSGEEQLYLVPSVSRGISADKEQVLSRSSLTNTENLQTIGVFATMTASDALYMDNVEVTADNMWTPTTQYLWPGDGKLHFNAYSPYTDAGGSEGVVALHAYGTGGELTLSYITPADVANQFDLLWADPVEASASPCELNFNHALTAVRFVSGEELAPCTVKSIEISGVTTSGTLDLTNGQWSETSGNGCFAVSPDKELSAADGSKYIAVNTPLIEDEQTFILLPQLLNETAQIKLTIEVNGSASEFTASIAGQQWTAGTTVTYRLSANPSSTELILSVLDADGNTVSTIDAPYTGADIKYQVKSSFRDGSEDVQPIEWTASLVDKDGNPIESPSWLVGYAASGEGNSECTLNTDLANPVYLALSEQSTKLRNAADVNASSGYTPYNLSNSTGAPSVENTANCYLVNAPGKYSLPLVYGNAVKDGGDNQSAYVSTLPNNRTNQRQALLNFINHLGNAISDPYIYNNAGCKPASAKLVWEEKIGLIRNVKLSDDKKSLEFDVPAEFIRQGNAMVAVSDSEGTVMWSWQIWVTDFENGSDWYTIPVEGTDYHLYPHTLGRVYPGDRTQFPEEEVIMRITQKNVPEGQEAQSVDVTVKVAGKEIETKGYYSFYQWGRKDPMVSGVDQFYNGNREEVNGAKLPQTPFGTSHKEAIEQSIIHPDMFLSTSSSTLSVSPFYSNLWSIDDASLKPNAINDPNVKTIYDPCPVGAKVPVGNEFISLMKYTFTYDESSNSVYFTLPSGRQANFALLGYREYGGVEQITGVTGGFWTAVAAGRSSVLAQYFHVGKSTTDLTFQTISPIFGFGLRPVKDE